MTHILICLKKVKRLNFVILFQQALTKVPTNVQHFADLGVYKHLKKKTHLTKDVLFPHLPGHPEGVDPRKVSKIYFSFLSMFNGIGMIDIA